jgi:DNA-directed RNA polymerase specialized sigma24 family protein
VSAFFESEAAARARAQMPEDGLSIIAQRVARRVRPNQRDQGGDADDCFQEAWLAGFNATRSALRAKLRTSKKILDQRMQQQCYRMLRKHRKEIRDGDHLQ